MAFHGVHAAFMAACRYCYVVSMAKCDNLLYDSEMKATEDREFQFTELEIGYTS